MGGSDAYIRSDAAAVRRIADASGKFAIASAALGVYEGISGAMFIAVVFMAASIVLTVRGAK